MKQFILFSFIFALITVSLNAQPTVKPGIHWVKTTWYLPIPGTFEPDKSKVPDIYMYQNSLAEYNEKGMPRSIMDYKRGSDEISGSTMRYYWEGGTRLKKEVRENDAYVAIYSTTYTYDATGHEIKKETVRGPGDRVGISSNEYTESSWSGNNKTKETRRDAKGALQSEVTYTYDANGRKIREDYYPAGLYGGKTFSYDNKGNMINETFLDREGKVYTVRTYEYNSAGKETKFSSVTHYQGKEQDKETRIRTYDSHGERTSDKTSRDGKLTWDYSWKHSYDAKGNRVQTVHIKSGKPEYVEVLEIRYY